MSTSVKVVEGQHRPPVGLKSVCVCVCVFSLVGLVRLSVYSVSWTSLRVLLSVKATMGSCVYRLLFAHAKVVVSTRAWAGIIVVEASKKELEGLASSHRCDIRSSSRKALSLAAPLKEIR